MTVTAGTGRTRSLWYTGDLSCAIQTTEFARPQTGEVMVQTLFSGISRGTEGLVFRGEVPECEWQRMRAPFQSGDFPFPVKYGYANVGKVVEGDAALMGQTVFSLYPHQGVFTLPSGSCVPVPADVLPERAVLTANMETALNAIWDGKPSPGDHICVVGGGVVGLLTAYVANGLPGSTVTVVDTNAARAPVARALGLGFSLPEDAPGDQDLVFHTSATPGGLGTALTCAGDGAAIVEMSWYGAREVPVPLGQDFHSRRLKLISSQVGTIPAERQARWTYRRRMETALSLLSDPVLDRLISHRIPFDSLPEQLPDILNKASDVLAALVVYDGESKPTTP
ncbi:zinc-dependent alcohol dehydrogenase [Roseibium aggregatum]|uniref:Zinc-binding alcohol dehydrogenase n=1 Tax=Roseibium aggregatum TaxID=187304 RepID=A0A939E8C6_9HYPH|nr:zinc-binding alcohol dehydrogenase [Roseibium aggregatum]MBN9668746.1 zinc-binding alcohol dehydrogenase [Roseibium aggregatum]